MRTITLTRARMIPTDVVLFVDHIVGYEATEKGSLVYVCQMGLVAVMETPDQLSTMLVALDYADINEYKG